MSRRWLCVKSSGWISILAVLGLGLSLESLASKALAQGILVIDSESGHRWRLPRPMPPIVPRPPIVDPAPPLLYRVKSLEVDARIRDSVAKVQLSQIFVNEGSQIVEARCIVPIPYDAVVDGLTFMVDGQEIEGKLLAADEARRIYQNYVRKSQDPALVQWIGSGLLQTNVFPIPPGAQRTVSIGYSQILKKTNGMIDWYVPIKAAGYSSQPIEKLSVSVYLEDKQKLGNIYSPTHTIETKRTGDHSASVRYQTKTDSPTLDFRLLAATSENPLAANFIGYRPDSSDAGYFMMLLHPRLEATVDSAPKDIVLVLDKSGSMRGEKIDQARKALLYVLNHLPKKDRVGIVVYDSQVMTFRDQMTDASDSISMESAKSFVNALNASGSTNIDQALDTAMKMIAKSDRPAYVVHLSDGRPTIGERDERQITAHAVKANQRRARMFNFGVGHDVNSKLMNRLSSECFGQTFFVAPDEDIESSVSGLYDRLGQVALSDVRWELVGQGSEGAQLTMVYPTRVVDLFSNDQTSIVGRYRGRGKATLVITGKLGGREMRFEQVIDLEEANQRSDGSYVASLWASRRASAIIDEIDLEGKKEDLVRELIDLAKKYGILTEYTAFLAEEPSSPRTVAGIRDETVRRLDNLKDESGSNAFRQRSVNQLGIKAENLASSEKAQALSANAGASAGAGALGGANGLSPNSPIGLPSPTMRPLSSLPSPQSNKGIGPASSSSPTPGTPHVPKRIGDRVFFFRSGQWIDSKVGETVPSNAKKIERFSDAYFSILEKNIRLLEPLLDLNQPIIVELDGEVYVL